MKSKPKTKAMVRQRRGNAPAASTTHRYKLSQLIKIQPVRGDSSEITQWGSVSAHLTNKSNEEKEGVFFAATKF